MESFYVWYFFWDTNPVTLEKEQVEYMLFLIEDYGFLIIFSVLWMWASYFLIKKLPLISEKKKLEYEMLQQESAEILKKLKENEND